MGAFDGNNVYGLLNTVHCLFERHNKSCSLFDECVFCLGGHVCAEIVLSCQLNFRCLMWVLGDDGRENEALSPMTHKTHTAHLAVRIRSSDVLVRTTQTTVPHLVENITIQR